jgi:hypothetical protein
MISQRPFARTSTARALLARTVVVLALVSTLALAACGGGDDDEEATPTTEAEPTAAETADDGSGGVEEETVTVDRDFWHSGWHVTLGDAVLAEGEFGGAAVTFEAEFENVGEDTATFDSQLVLTSGGNNYEAERFQEGFPEVPGEFSQNGEIVIEVDDEFMFDDATLIVGNAQNNQAFVPIGEDSEHEYVSLEPQEIAAAGNVTAGAVTLTVERAELRADRPDWHDEMEEGSMALTVYFSATPQTGIQLGQGLLSSDNVIVQLPDGSGVAVISDGRSGVNALLQGKEGTTIPDLSARYAIPTPEESGTYLFILRGAYGPGGAEVEGQLAFQIEVEDTGSPVTPGASPAATATP